MNLHSESCDGSCVVKICVACNEIKLTCQFYSAGAKGGFQARCKPCHTKASWQREKEKRKDPIARLESNARRFGIEASDLWAKLKEQDGKCAICLASIVISTEMRQRDLHIDHCHETGKFRGLLCGNCNNLLGMAKESEQTLLSAVQYLIANRGGGDSQ